MVTGTAAFRVAADSLQRCETGVDEQFELTVKCRAIAHSGARYFRHLRQPEYSPSLTLDFLVPTPNKVTFCMVQ